MSGREMKWSDWLLAGAVTLFFLVIGIMMSMDAVSTGNEYAPFIGGAVVEARVVESWIVEEQGADDYVLRISYTSPDGVERSTEMDIITKGTFDNVSAGDTIEVILAPDDPSRALVHRYFRNQSAFTVGRFSSTPLLFFGLALILMGVAGLGMLVLMAWPSAPAPQPPADLVPEVSVHPISPGALIFTGVGGALGLLVSFAFLSVLISARPPYDGWALASFIAGTVLLGVSLWCFRVVLLRKRYTVTVSGSGIQVGESAQWIPWSQIRRIRMRSFLQRLDLLDHEDRRLATVEHQVEDADDLIHWIQQTVQEHRSDHATMQRRFGRRSGDRFRFLMLGLGICAGFAILWWLVPDLSAWWLLALPALLVGLHVVTAGAICQVDLTDDELIIFTLWRTTRIPRSGIFGIDLEMEGDDFQGRYARAMILLDDGTWREITPLGCDALEVYDSLSVWWDRSPA